MSIKTAIATLLLFSSALLTGCTISLGSDTKPAQVVGSKVKAADNQQDITSQPTTDKLHEDLRLANERAKLAEEKAELEKQKREFAEERLERLNKTDRDENPESSSEDTETGGS